MVDKPYTCMLNPIIPCIGIMGSGTFIGYIDVLVWTSFFGVVVIIAISYFLYVIPRKYLEKLRKISSRYGSYVGTFRRSSKNNVRQH
jgi:hypothetical protein